MEAQLCHTNAIFMLYLKYYVFAIFAQNTIFFLQLKISSQSETISCLRFILSRHLKVFRVVTINPGK